MAGHGNGCYIWNIHMQTRPEQSYSAPLEISSTALNIYGDTIFGGLKDGNICVWDPRCKPVPVLTTVKPIITSNKGHDFPIKNMKIVGQRNAHVLMTSSEDSVCGWDLSMLAHPLEHVSVDHTTMAFMPDHSGSFLVGRGDGKIATVNR